MNKYEYFIAGMTCSSCVQLIEDQIKSSSEIEECSVNYQLEKCVIVTKKEVSISALELKAKLNNKLQAFGYEVISIADKNQSKLHFKKKLLTNAILLLSVGGIFMVLMFLPHHYFVHSYISSAIQFIISMLLIAFLGRVQIRSVFVHPKKYSMDALLGLGILITAIHSFISLFFLKNSLHLYIESVPFILGFNFLSKYLDQLALNKIRQKTESLLALQIKFAKKMVGEGVVRTPVVELVIGDVVQVFPGEIFPVDGRIIKGQSSINEASVTGEAESKSKTIGNEVFSGTQNIDGLLEVQVTKSFGDNEVGHLIKLIEKAAKNKPAVMNLADKLVKWFIPFIILLSLLTFAFWMINHETKLAYSTLISVLLVACPCALSLAPSLGMMISSTRLKALNIEIAGGRVLEQANLIDTIIFDKTGTLTLGKPVVIRCEMDAELKECIAAACMYSSHPLSKAIIKYLSIDNLILEPEEFKDIPGKGIEAVVAGKKILIGKPINSDKNSNLSQVEVLVDGISKAYFWLSDEVKSDAKKAIKQMQALSLNVIIASGDNEFSVSEMAKELSISEFYFNQKPSDKFNLVEALEKEGKKVLMIGDGINDSVALERAFLSMSMGSGAELSRHISDVIIPDDGLFYILNFLKISRRTMLIIKQNLWYAFIYNILVLPLAMGVFFKTWELLLTPMWASLAMGLSSISVILNSLRLLKNEE